MGAYRNLTAVMTEVFERKSPKNFSARLGSFEDGFEKPQEV
jgi:hypothetical protein